jgi:hypothetical protein
MERKAYTKPELIRKRKKMKVSEVISKQQLRIEELSINITFKFQDLYNRVRKSRAFKAISDQRGDVPGWVLVVLMTTGLVTAIWTIAAPRLTAILRNSLDSMNGIR